jgi:hypothetical protein
MIFSRENDFMHSIPHGVKHWPFLKGMEFDFYRKIGIVFGNTYPNK